MSGENINTPMLLKVLVLLRGLRIDDLERMMIDKYGGIITECNVDQFLDDALNNSGR